MSTIVAFQGEPGANSHIACLEVYPDCEVKPCHTFEDVFAEVSRGTATYGMIPIENTVAGRVADIHMLLPTSNLHIIGEYFLPVRHQLLGIKGATPETATDVFSHVHALSQCKRNIRSLGLRAHVSADTAGAAHLVADWMDPSKVAIATSLAAKVYKLEVLVDNFEDEDHNTTRFVVFSRDANMELDRSRKLITSLIFRVRNIPASLYKALGGFATNGVNVTKLESYQLGGKFYATLFFADFEGHPEDPAPARALEELRYFSQEVRIFGTYYSQRER